MLSYCLTHGQPSECPESPPLLTCYFCPPPSVPMARIWLEFPPSRITVVNTYQSLSSVFAMTGTLVIIFTLVPCTGWHRAGTINDKLHWRQGLGLSPWMVFPQILSDCTQEVCRKDHMLERRGSWPLLGQMRDWSFGFSIMWLLKNSISQNPR